MNPFTLPITIESLLDAIELRRRYVLEHWLPLNRKKELRRLAAMENYLKQQMA